MLDGEDSMWVTDIDRDVGANEVSFFNVCRLGVEAYSGSDGLSVRSASLIDGLERGKLRIEGLLGRSDGLMLGLKRDDSLTGELWISSGDFMLGWERGERLDFDFICRRLCSQPTEFNSSVSLKQDDSFRISRSFHTCW